MRRPRGERDEEGAGRFDLLLEVVVKKTGAPRAFLVHETGTLLAEVPGGTNGHQLASQASAIVEVAAEMARSLHLRGLNLAVLDCRGGRVLLLAAGSLVLGCVVSLEADLDATLSSLQDALEGL